MAATDCAAAPSQYAILSSLTQRDEGHVSHAVIAKYVRTRLEDCPKNGVMPHLFASQFSAGAALSSACHENQMRGLRRMSATRGTMSRAAARAADLLKAVATAFCRQAQKFQRCALATRKSRNA